MPTIRIVLAVYINAILSLLLYLLSVFTVYDKFCQGPDLSSVEARVLLNALADHRRRVLHLIVSLSLLVIHVYFTRWIINTCSRWHGYTTEESHMVTWGAVISASIYFTLKCLKHEDRIKEQLEDFGPVIFSLMYSMPVHAAYIFYVIAIIELSSPLHAVLQISFVLMFDTMPMVPKLMEKWKNISATKTIENFKGWWNAKRRPNPEAQVV